MSLEAVMYRIIHRTSLPIFIAVESLEKQTFYRIFAESPAKAAIMN